MTRVRPPVAVAFVHHANQLVIGDGYADRDGITAVCRGYTAVLRLHRRFKVPCALHLSGTLIEALAWHHPEFLTEVRTGRAEGWLTLIGGTYAEPVMPLHDPAANTRQLLAMADLLRHHLAVPDGATSTAWLPERVWDPALAAQLTDRSLPHGGFRRVLVDDRVLAPPGSARALADRHGPYGAAGGPPVNVTGLADPALLQPRQITVEGRELQMVPICSHLRYLIPARSLEHLWALEEFVADVRSRADHPERLLLVYADDLERTAGVAGWEPALADYRRVIRWFGQHPLVQPVALDAWLDVHPPRPGPVPAVGTYFELAVDWRAGEDYRGWADNPQWHPYATLLAELESQIRAARGWDKADARLTALAERLVMAGTHETAWHDQQDGQRQLAPWVRATASHARLARPLLAAARWATAGSRTPEATVCDIDGDGTEELILAGGDVWCLVAPAEGARVCLLAHRCPERTGRTAPDLDPPGAAVIVGNPVDHWNLQEELHRFMDVPPAHPGALADHHPHLAWHPRPPVHTGHAVTVDLLPAAPSPFMRKRRYALIAGVPALASCLHGVPARPITVENLVVPDYLGALRDGHAGIEQVGGGCWTGWRWTGRQCWIGYDPAQSHPTAPMWTAAGHGHPLALTAEGGHLDLLIGAGPAHDSSVTAWLSTARSVLHTSSPATTTA
ncbi:hypothetical protein [Streptomyces sp. MUSC 125]|uniref:hypothetical protein n=1 Tax=Streptomyces sp. MUSC 125 TaxID=1428624 RepID=UPI000D145F24|nr:hypothetical protein [Streptomyces sp. MUSC 125]